jgi:hypothetical protein
VLASSNPASEIFRPSGGDGQQLGYKFSAIVHLECFVHSSAMGNGSMFADPEPLGDPLY